MASGLDELGKAVKKHRGDILLTIAALATAENKWKALGKAVKDIAVWKLIGPLGIVLGVFKGIEGAVRGVLRDTGSLAAVLNRMSQIKGLERQFTVLLGTVTAARKRVAELMQFTNGQKLFDLETSGRAARELEILTKGAFAGRSALDTLGDSAVASGNGLEDVASRVGQIHKELRDGQPIRSTAEELASMGVISTTAAGQLAAMQESGASATTVFQALVGELEKSKGALDEHARTVDGVSAAYKKAKDQLAQKFGEPFQESEINRMKDATTVLTALQAPIASLAQYLSMIVSPLENVTVRFASWLSKLGLLGGVVSGSVTVIKTLTTGLLALGLAFGVRALGAFLISIVRVTGTTGKAGAAIAALRATMVATTAATRQLAAGNTGLAVQAAAAGASSLRSAAALGVAAIATKGLSLAVRALLTGTGIGLLVVLLGYAGEKLLGWSDRTERAAQAQRDLADSNRQTESALAKQIAAIQNLDDAQQALTTSTEALAAAKLKLAELEDKRRRGEDVSDGELAEARRAVAAASRTTGQLSGGIADGRCGLSSAQEAILRENARRDLALDEAGRGEAIERATGVNRLRLMEEEQQRLARDAEEGRALREERAQLEADERSRSARGGRFSPAALNAQIRRRASSPIIREEQNIADMRASGADPGRIQERERLLAIRRERLEANQAQNEQRAQEMRAAVERERRGQALNEADLRAERQIATLRDRGFEREEQVAKSRIDALIDQQGILRAFGDEQGAAELDPRIAAAERELRLMQQKAELQRAMDAAHLKVLEMEQRATVAAARGDFSEADRLRQAAIALRDLMEQRRSFEEKMNSGEFTEAGAEAAVAAEQATRESDREARRNVFREERSRALAAEALALSSEDGAAAELTKLQDEERFRGALGEGLAAGLPAGEAASFAMLEAQAAIQRQVAEAQRGGVVDSLTRVGGGGGVGSDPVLSVAQRQQALQERMVSLLTQIAAQAPSTPPAAGEPDIPFE